MPLNLIQSSAATVDLSAAFSEWQLVSGATLTGNPGLRITASNIRLFIDGDITNTLGDTIRVETAGSNAFIHVSAGSSITASGSNTADGIESLSGADFVTIINDGTINAQDNALEANGTGDTVFNNGNVDGNDAGINVDGAGHTIVNTGLVTGGAGIDIFGGVDDGGHVIYNTGIIRGTAEGIFVASNHDSPITLFNSGNISATNGPRAFEGSDTVQIIFNSGTMFGNISFDGGADFYSGREGGTVTGTVFGENGNDVLIGSATADTLNGGADEDRIIGGAGNDLLVGAGGDDFINGEQGDDTIRGGAGDDIMRGGQGADIVNGFSGDDILDGGQGNDQLLGGVGADTFQFQLLAGNDRIFGWEDGTDEIDLTTYGIANFNAVNAAISASGGNAVVDLTMLGGNGSITINGAAGVLDASDFLL